MGNAGFPERCSLFLYRSILVDDERVSRERRDKVIYMGHSRAQFVDHLLSNLRVTLLASKLSNCTYHWKRFNFSPSFNKLYYICDGEGWIRVDNKDYYPKSGEFLLIPAGTQQSYSVTEGPPYTMYWCHFNSNVSFMQLFRQFDFSYFAEVRDSVKVVDAFKQLIENSMDNGPAASLKIQASLFNLISIFIESAIPDHSKDLTQSSIRKLLDTVHYIDTNLSLDMTIEELALHAHFHPNYLIRVFKAYLGMTPKRYIHEKRLEKAEQLLVSTDLTISEISHTTGFNDPSYFAASFKRKSGLSPSKYRYIYGQDGAGP
jgi:AraC family transcriptional regulator, arabinose operon regulatory protein